jgi:hypothetical protein
VRGDVQSAAFPKTLFGRSMRGSPCSVRSKSTRRDQYRSRSVERFRCRAGGAVDVGTQGRRSAESVMHRSCCSRISIRGRRYNRRKHGDRGVPGNAQRGRQGKAEARAYRCVRSHDGVGGVHVEARRPLSVVPKNTTAILPERQIKTPPVGYALSASRTGRSSVSSSVKSECVKLRKLSMAAGRPRK